MDRLQLGIYIIYIIAINVKRGHGFEKKQEEVNVKV